MFHILQLLRLSGHGMGLAVDWVGEVIAYAERPLLGSSEVHIQTYDIWHGVKKLMAKFSFPDQIKKFLLSPMSRYFSSRLMTCDND